jgi:hypothetical protein
MMTWTEANFLERLQAPLKTAQEAGANACPDAEMMSAYVGDTASEFVQKAVAEHLKGCVDCRDLAERLAGFEEAAAENSTALSPIAQVEWQNAEKRLNIEAENFLRTTEVDFARAARVATAAKEERAAAWRFPWGKTAWSAAAVALLVVAGFFLMRKEGTPAAGGSTANAPVGAITEPSAANPGSANGPAVAPPMVVANDAGPGTVAASPSTEGSVPIGHDGASASNRVTKRASAKHEAPAASGSPPVEAKAEDTGTVAPKMSADTNANAEAGSSGAPPVNGTTSTAVSARTSHAVAAAGGRVPNTANAALPSVIRLDAGTRVWIVFKTVHRDGDAKFAFVGSLLEPIKDGGATTGLAKDTEIDGAGVISDGKTSLYVQEIVIHGVHYRLKGANGAVKPAAGGGAAVGFNAGQVQEMWLSSPAEYERTGDAAAGSAQP